MRESGLPRHWSTRLSLCMPLALAVGLLILCWCLAATPPLALADRSAQPLPPGSFTEGQTAFTRDDGLADNSVTALWGDDRALWVGTLAGLSRYTLRGRNAGLTWQTFSQRHGMAADAVSDLWGDDAGGLWVAHPDQQISFFDGSSWTTYENLTETLSQAYKQIVDSKAAGPLWAIEEAGRVWTLGEGTVGYYVGAVWRPYGEDTGIPRGRLTDVWTGNGAWVASETGQIAYFDGAAWTTFGNVFDAVQRQYETIAAAGPASGPLWVVDQDGAVWVRNAYNQRNPRPDVRRFAEGRWTNFSTGDGLANGYVAELRLDQLGRIWARHVADANGQGGGLSLYTEDPSTPGTGNWTAINPAFSGNVTDFWPAGTDGVWIASFEQPETGGAPVGGLTFVSLNTWRSESLAELRGATASDAWLDENDNLWLGLSSDPRRGLEGGLWRYRPPQGGRPARWTPVEGLLDKDVRDLWGDGLGNLWVATADGVNRITLRNRRLITFTQPLRPDRIAGDAAGNVWTMAFGEEGQVWGWNGSSWAMYTVGEGLSGGPYSDLHVSDEGTVYLAGDRGLDIWEGDAWETFAALPGRHVKRIWQDGLGDLWLSSEITPGRPFNLSLNQGSRWETVLTEIDSRRMGPEPLALVRDDRGRAWLGAPAGLFIYEPSGDAGWRGLGAVEGLAPGPVPALYKDASGTMWVAQGEQVYRSEYLPCESGSDPLAPPASIVGVGSPAPAGVCWAWRVFEPQVGVVNLISGGPEGSVLFAGEAGVSVFNPAPPDLRLEGVVNLITGEENDGSEAIVLTLGRNAIRIDLVAIAPTLNTRQISYRYRLEGVDEDWRLAPASSLGGKRAAITYAGLPGGTYTFTVVARTEALEISPEISFTLFVLSRPPRLSVDSATVAGRTAEQPGALRAFVGQPIAFQLSGGDDQTAPLTYRYRVEGLSDAWTTTTRSEISFTLSAAGTYTFVAMALDEQGQASEPIGSQISVSARGDVQDAPPLPPKVLAAGLSLLAVSFIGSALLLRARYRRRESL